VLGLIASDGGTAEVLADSDIIDQLIALLADKQEDDDVTLQTVYAFYQMMRHEPTREIILETEQLVTYFVDLLQVPLSAHEQQRRGASHLLCATCP
jgi:kinesin-associated protein 3